MQVEGVRTQAHPIRPASTVVVARRLADTAEVYCVLRSANVSFMPGTLVFPGGRMDEADGAQHDDDAWLRTARREVAEETRLAVDPANMRWFDTWLTPSIEPRRYLARFYWCWLDDTPDPATHASVDGVEAVAGAWESPQDVLTRHAQGAIDVPPPTLTILRWLSRASIADVIAARDDLREPILPKVIVDQGAPTIVLPHDAQYASLPGEGAAAPRRAFERDYPRRIVRTEGRWHAL